VNNITPKLIEKKKKLIGQVRVQKTLITQGTQTEINLRRTPSESRPRNDRQPDNKVNHTAVVYFMALS
jgi:hypothetical protein